MLSTERAVMQRFLGEELTISEVARRLGRSRQTIYNWINKEEQPVRWTRMSKLDPHRAYIKSRLERFDLPATVLLSELRAQGYDGGITILRDFAAKIKKRHVRRLVDRFETEPGRQAQVDWASCGTIIHEGRRRRLSLLTVVLGYSRTIWAEFVVSERRPVMVDLLERCFRDLGGIPRELLFDNLKQVVDKPRTADSPAKIQQGFQVFADHWGFETVASPPYWPRAKGKVERAIQYIEGSFLEGRAFTDLDDLNGQLRHWLATVANVRIHGTTGERPVDRMSADQEAMLPLGQIPAYPSMTVHPRLADHDARISFGSVRYSVDPMIISGRRGEPVEVHQGTDERLRIFHQGRLVGNHALAPKGSPPQDDPLHAASRRLLRQLPSCQRPRGKNPAFEQLAEPSVPDWVTEAPLVAVRTLTDYEVTSCRLS